MGNILLQSGVAPAGVDSTKKKTDPADTCHIALMNTRNFDYKEQVEVDKYYPQYYHKMDKVL
jgi:hypothetical protein